MSLEDKSFDRIDETDLQALCTGQEREGKILEFKEAQAGNSEGDRKEFLADVTSFANTSGGHLIFGIKETGGVATEICGISIDDPDAEVLRMENLLTSGVQRRLSGYAIKPLHLRNGKAAIIIRIPRSWALPHRVILGGHDKFYARNSAGKYPLDVPELQASFLLSETTIERIRGFRVDRLARINGGETPVSMPRGPKTVLHVIPLNAFAPGVNLNVSSFENDIRWLPLIHSPGGMSHRHNFDGFVTFSSQRNGEESLNYAQIFRNGSIEAVNASFIREYEGQRLIGGSGWEDSLINVLPSFFQALTRLNVQPPALVMLSALGVKGYTMYVSTILGPEGDPIDRDILMAPEIMVESFSDDPGKILKPAFDTIWNAAGHPRSLSYDEHGERIRH